MKPILILIALTSVLLEGCAWFDNQVTYFNTYYNIRRITVEIEDEFEFQDENKRKKPRLFVPAIEGVSQNPETSQGNTMLFLKNFTYEKARLQPVSTKVDSILIKGSKILANHPKSRYVEGTLFHMAKAYFFKSEYLPSQQKCLEQLERFPDGEFSPDAHLYLALDYLVQKKVSQGVAALSKCIDVAWYRNRWDILSTAYRIQAELALEKGELDKAVQPYRQAIAQSEDNSIRAQWQVEIAGIYYRMGQYELAEKNFAKVFDYRPDAVAEFEARLYRAASNTQLNRLDSADVLLTSLENEKKFEEWSSFITAERLALERKRKGEAVDDPVLAAAERKADTSYVGKPELMAQAFQKGMDLFKRGEYDKALPYFAKAKVVRTPIYDVANKYFTYIKQWEDAQRKMRQFRVMAQVDSEKRDTALRSMAREAYAIGRLHETMGQVDSAMQYYVLAHDSTAAADPERGRYLYAQSRLLRDSDPDKADSLSEIVAELYPNSDVGRQASGELGYVADAVIDDAAELFRSGSSFRAVRDYVYASRRFNEIAERFPDSEYAPKALYALGWMFERQALDVDSALHYYGLLVERYPRSEYAREIRPSLEYALAKANDMDVSDSLLLRDLDDDLLKKAKEGEKGLLDQMIDNNRDALQVTNPNFNMPNIQGLLPGSQDGAGQQNINDMLQQQMQNVRPLTPSTPADSTARPVPPNRQDTARPRRP